LGGQKVGQGLRSNNLNIHGMGKSTLASEKPSLAQQAEAYKKLAPTYESERFSDPYGQYDLRESRALIRETVLRLAKERPRHWQALDVGCGTGRASIVLAELGGIVCALDAASEMLQQCSAIARDEGLADRLTTVRASADAIPFPKDHFDMVFSFRFLHLFPPQVYPDLLGEMLRVTKPGGYVVVEFKNRWYGMLRPSKNTHAVSARQMREITRTMGVSLHETPGVLLPKCWHFRNSPTISQVARWLARHTLRSLSATRVAVIRKKPIIVRADVRPRKARLSRTSRSRDI
jgi:ubiquinone/menaquinone biosynthesis C-methylase UbiE